MPVPFRSWSTTHDLSPSSLAPPSLGRWSEPARPDGLRISPADCTWLTLFSRTPRRSARATGRRSWGRPVTVSRWTRRRRISCPATPQVALGGRGRTRLRRPGDCRFDRRPVPSPGRSGTSAGHRPRYRTDPLATGLRVQLSGRHRPRHGPRCVPLIAQEMVIAYGAGGVLHALGWPTVSRCGAAT